MKNLEQLRNQDQGEPSEVSQGARQGLFSISQLSWRAAFHPLSLCPKPSPAPFPAHPSSVHLPLPSHPALCSYLPSQMGEKTLCMTCCEVPVASGQSRSSKLSSCHRALRIMTCKSEDLSAGRSWSIISPHARSQGSFLTKTCLALDQIPVDKGCIFRSKNNVLGKKGWERDELFLIHLFVPFEYCPVTCVTCLFKRVN